MDYSTTLLSRMLIDNIKKHESEIMDLQDGAYFQMTYASTPNANRIIQRWSEQAGYMVGGWTNLTIPPSLKTPSLLVYVGKEEPRHNGAFDKKNQLLFAIIGIPLTENGRLDYNAAIPMIKAVLRHELEHSGQTGESRPPMGGDFADIESMRQYLSHPAEVEAWVAGLYKYAKTAKIPFTQVIDNQLQRLYGSMVKAQADTIESRHMLDDIRSRWLSYQKQRFPSAV